MGNGQNRHLFVPLHAHVTLCLFACAGCPSPFSCLVHAPISLLLRTRTDFTFTGRRYPAIPRRVTEYLVFERKNWQDAPWTVREEAWVGKGAIAKV